MKIYTELPDGKCECPVCHGSGRKAAGELSKYKNSIAGYDTSNDTVSCNNCGGQLQWGKSLGYVSPNKDGTGCTHYYKSKNIGRCLTRYQCMYCVDYHDIDSGG